MSIQQTSAYSSKTDQKCKTKIPVCIGKHGRKDGKHLFHTQAGDCLLVVQLPWYSFDTPPGHIQAQLLFNNQKNTDYTNISHLHTPVRLLFTNCYTLANNPSTEVMSYIGIQASEVTNWHRNVHIAVTVITLYYYQSDAVEIKPVNFPIYILKASSRITEILQSNRC